MWIFILSYVFVIYLSKEMFWLSTYCPLMLDTQPPAPTVTLTPDPNPRPQH